MSQTKTFPVGTILTVTTGRLLTKSKGPRDNGIGNLYELLAWMTNDSPFTHQLGRFAEECKPWIYRWFPEIVIADAALDKLDDWIAKSPTCPDQGIKAWIAELRMTEPKLLLAYEVPKIPMDDHETKNAFDELVEMRGGSRDGIVVINVPEHDGC